MDDLHQQLQHIEGKMIKNLKELSKNTIDEIKAIFFDIDDTFSLKGKILPQAYQSLWNLKNTGIKLVPITGRPAGWCDHIARMWPVDAIVGENGAFFFWHDKKKEKLEKYFFDSEIVRTQKRERLHDIKDEILSSIPGTGLASDQNYREADLAIDFCEYVPPLSWDQIDKICAVFEKHHATYKVSSIHVNGWFGQYSKIEMTKIMARHLWHVDLDKDKHHYLFCGDSPNDEPMFEYFPVSIGVNNVLNFVDRMTYFPAYVTQHEGGEGFAEMTQYFLSNRKP